MGHGEWLRRMAADRTSDGAVRGERTRRDGQLVGARCVDAVASCARAAEAHQAGGWYGAGARACVVGTTDALGRARREGIGLPLFHRLPLATDFQWEEGMIAERSQQGAASGKSSPSQVSAKMVPRLRLAEGRRRCAQDSLCVLRLI